MGRRLEIDAVRGLMLVWMVVTHLPTFLPAYTNQPFGFVFSNCRITGKTPAVKTYLGRPWRAYSTVIFMNTKMDLKIAPEGWHEWEHDGKPSLPTAFYSEYRSSGEGANPSRQQLSEAEAKQFEMTTFFDGWNAAEVH